jgi:hypothetical protein
MGFPKKPNVRIRRSRNSAPPIGLRIAQETRVTVVVRKQQSKSIAAADTPPVMTRFHAFALAVLRAGTTMTHSRQAGARVACTTVFTCNELFRIGKSDHTNGGRKNTGAKKTPAETGEG